MMFSSLHLPPAQLLHRLKQIGAFLEEDAQIGDPPLLEELGTEIGIAL